MKRLVLPGHSTSDSGVGDFRVSIQIARAKGERFEPLRALVDTGSTFTWIPRDVLEGLGVRPEQEWPFELADGREQRYAGGVGADQTRGAPRPANDCGIRTTGLRADSRSRHVGRVSARG